MSDELSQAEADHLLAIRKVRVDDTTWDLPGLGSLIVPLVSEDQREQFLLDIYRGGRIELRKGTYQTRARNTVTLARLDFGGRPHRNPDGMDIPSPHLHLYTEEFGDKVAVPVPLDAFPNLTDTWALLHDFMRFCSVVEPPIFNRGLFS